MHVPSSSTVTPYPCYSHDPQAVLDYNVDWSDWLTDGDSITSHDVALSGDPSLAVDSTDANDTRVVAWLSGGTPWTVSIATFRISTALGRTDERSITINVRDR